MFYLVYSPVKYLNHRKSLPSRLLIVRMKTHLQYLCEVRKKYFLVLFQIYYCILLNLLILIIHLESRPTLLDGFNEKISLGWVKLNSIVS